MTVAEFEHMLISRATPPLLEPAHPTGLYLSKVTYPYLNLPTRTEFSGLQQKDWIEID